jgi:hypothetical protein
LVIDIGTVNRTVVLDMQSEPARRAEGMPQQTSCRHALSPIEGDGATFSALADEFSNLVGSCRKPLPISSNLAGTRRPNKAICGQRELAQR